MADVGEEELAELRSRAERGDAAAAELESTRQAAAADLRAALLEANPDLPPELVSGATSAELRTSIESARLVVQGVRERAFEELTALAAAKPQPMGFRPAGQRSDRAPEEPPEKTRGVARIAWALTHPGPGRTE